MANHSLIGQRDSRALGTLQTLLAEFFKIYAYRASSIPNGCPPEKTQVYYSAHYSTSYDENPNAASTKDEVELEAGVVAANFISRARDTHRTETMARRNSGPGIVARTRPKVFHRRF
jgi:hypothetical protein